MSDLIKIHGEEWKVADIQDNVDWTRQHEWHFKEYDNPEDHAHCLICYWTIFASRNREESTGYFYGGSTWLCNECYSKFVDNFN